MPNPQHPPEGEGELSAIGLGAADPEAPFPGARAPGDERPASPPRPRPLDHLAARRLDTGRINLYSGLLLRLGLPALSLLIGLASSRRAGCAGDPLPLAALAAFGWVFFVNEVYRPQYGVWLVALAALCGAPPASVAFRGVDAGYFAASFIDIRLEGGAAPARGWFFDQVLWPSMVLREAAILAVVAWAVARIVRDGRPPVADPAVGFPTTGPAGGVGLPGPASREPGD
jgi:hypothetical protein